MTIVALIIAFVIVLIVAALAWQFFKDTAAVPKKSSIPGPTPPDQKGASQIPAEPAKSPAFAPVPVYGESSIIYKDLRSHLVKGIEDIFSETPPADGEISAPRLRDAIDPQALQIALGHLESMDQFRTSQLELQRILNDPRSQLTELSKNITSDPLLTAKVLKMANSSYFGFTQKIDSIGHALMILGLQNVKNIMYREGLRGLFDAGPAHSKAAVARLWRHSNLVCICTQHFHDLFEGLNRGTLFTLGIVHDIGKLILMDISRKTAKKAAAAEGYPLDILIGEEDQLFGINHAVIGGCTLEHWNFSELMSLSVSMHHAPSFIEAADIKASQEALKYILSLFLADQVAKLFADWNEGTAHVYPLLKSYHDLIDKKKLIGKVIDVNFLNQMQAAETIAASEHPLSFQKMQNGSL